MEKYHSQENSKRLFFSHSVRSQKRCRDCSTAFLPKSRTQLLCPKCIRQRDPEQKAS